MIKYIDNINGEKKNVGEKEGKNRKTKKGRLSEIVKLKGGKVEFDDRIGDSITIIGDFKFKYLITEETDDYYMIKPNFTYFTTDLEKFLDDTFERGPKFKISSSGYEKHQYKIYKDSSKKSFGRSNRKMYTEEFLETIPR
jgi:hypothetical protein